MILCHSNPNDSLFLLVLPKVDLCYLLANCNFKTNIYLFLNFFFRNSLITCEYHYANENKIYFIKNKKKNASNINAMNLLIPVPIKKITLLTMGKHTQITITV